MTRIYKDISWLRERRQELDLSGRDFAAMIGMDKANYSRVERGIFSMKDKYIPAIEEALNIVVDKKITYIVEDAK